MTASLTWAVLDPGAAATLLAQAVDQLKADPAPAQLVLAEVTTSAEQALDRLAEVKQVLTARDVELTLNAKSLWTGPWQQLGIDFDEPETKRRIELAQSGRNTWQARWFAANQPSPTELSRVIRIDPALETERSRFVELLLALKERLDIRLRPARFDWQARTITAPQPGQFVDLDASWQRALSAARAGRSNVELAYQTIDPRDFLGGIGDFEPSELVASYQTRFKRDGDDASRARNIEVAASRIDGVILAPGEMISFNDVVGQRSKENGFEESWQIYKGEMVRGVGGGTCQVSSTLHAAALHAGLDIVERYPHSRALGYIPVGMDSTVAWPAIDFKFRNPFDVPMVVRAQVIDRELDVKIYAESVPGKVAIHRETLEVLPFEREVEVNEYFDPTRVKRKQKGVSGYRVLRTRSVRLRDGTTRRERQVDYYPPTPELFHVGADVDVDKDLPPLPEGARVPESEDDSDAETERG